MKTSWFGLLRGSALLGLASCAWIPAAAQIPVLKRSDVVFMYQAPRATYQDYGATVLAWGGQPTPRTLAEAQGMKFFGSVGMVTEFARYHDRFPQTYEQGLCRDVEGQPYKVPWLTDHQHKGVPYWWCCTRQPLFRQYISERVVDTVKAGAHGVHIDDHLGTAGGLWLGGCFCGRCVAEFRDYLKGLPNQTRTTLGIAPPEDFDFQKAARAWLAEKTGRKVTSHPLWSHWRVYQLRGAAQFMGELRALAARTAGHPVPVSANACLLWGPHLNDYSSLDFFSAEIEHHASTLRFTDSPFLAYRMADAVGRPLASTASGGDWAFLKERNLPGLAQGWMAASYAAGNCLMAPHHQWCYTPEKGTHWYDGPKEKFAPICQFIRQNAGLFDGFENHADLILAFSMRTFDREMEKVKSVAERLAAANVSYKLALGGDDVVDLPLRVEALAGSGRVLVLNPRDFTEADRTALASLPSARRYETTELAMDGLEPAVRVQSNAKVRALPRVKPGAAVVHLVNWNYEAEKDALRPLSELRLRLDLEKLGVPKVQAASLHAPGSDVVKLSLQHGEVTVPKLGLWAILKLE